MFSLPRKNRYLLPLLVLAAGGFAASTAVHSWVLHNRELILSDGGFYSFHAAVMAVGFPTGWPVKRLTLSRGRHAFWHLIRHGCPRWMSATIVLLVGYHAVDFLLFYFGPVETPAPEGHVSPETLRIFSATWTLGFGCSFAALYSIVAVEQATLSGQRPS